MTTRRNQVAVADEGKFPDQTDDQTGARAKGDTQRRYLSAPPAIKKIGINFK